mmetsp:Transcript_26376/g.42389  ORF Transcript_26376/g.42389 Transcript_26376/m.42389 type:complete len:90 (+) Transcript_26376:841-1110(+)
MCVLLYVCYRSSKALGYTTVLDQEDAKQIDIEDKDDEREKAVLMLKKLQSIRMDSMTVLRYILSKPSASVDEFYNADLDSDKLRKQSTQ